MNTILVVEDDSAIISSLEGFLKKEGFFVLSASSERAAMQQLISGQPDILLVDLGLEGGGSGFNVCRAAKNAGLPVIFLTARVDEDSIVKGLDMGDDYVSKPFRPRELLSRIKNVLRHYDTGSGLVRVGSIDVDTERGCVSRAGQEITLSALEYKLLLVFVDNRGRLLSRNKLLEDIWDIAGDYVNDNTLTVYIKRLREKIEDDPSDPHIIKTVRGLGYRMD